MKNKKDLAAEHPAFNKLPQKHKVFMLEYLKDFNATQAAIRAGYSKKCAQPQGARLLSSAMVQAALQESWEKINFSLMADVQELREFWTAVVRGDIGEICSWGDGGLTFMSSSEDIPKSKRRLIKKITVVERVSPKGDFTEIRTSVELHDPLKASELLGKSLGMFIDKNEVSGPNGGPIETKDEKRVIFYIPQNNRDGGN